MKLLIAGLMILGFAVTQAAPVDAAGWLRRNRARKTYVPRYTPQVRTTQATPRYQSYYRAPVSSYRRQRISGRNDWPGAIGNAPSNYRFFQNINGYWD